MKKVDLSKASSKERIAAEQEVKIIVLVWHGLLDLNKIVVYL